MLAMPVDTHSTSLPTSDISSLIIPEPINVVASSQSCAVIYDSKALGTIAQSCLVAIVVCLSFAVHRNIYPPTTKRPRHANFFSDLRSGCSLSFSIRGSL